MLKSLLFVLCFIYSVLSFGSDLGVSETPVSISVRSLVPSFSRQVETRTRLVNQYTGDISEIGVVEVTDVKVVAVHTYTFCPPIESPCSLVDEEKSFGLSSKATSQKALNIELKKDLIARTRKMKKPLHGSGLDSCQIKLVVTGSHASLGKLFTELVIYDDSVDLPNDDEPCSFVSREAIVEAIDGRFSKLPDGKLLPSWRK